VGADEVGQGQGIEVSEDRGWGLPGKCGQDPAKWVLSVPGFLKIFIRRSSIV
jgi:hypothetical protein